MVYNRVAHGTNHPDWEMLGTLEGQLRPEKSDWLTLQPSWLVILSKATRNRDSHASNSKTMNYAWSPT